MSKIIYNPNSVLISMILFVSLVVAIQTGYRNGRRPQASVDEMSKSHVNAIQASLLGVLALPLGFTFSLSLQRYDSRSEAVVDEVNAIGTPYLRAKLLPALIQNDVKVLLRAYLDVRIQEGIVPLSNQTERGALLKRAAQDQDAFWRYALQATEEDKNLVTSGLFIQSLNQLIDSYGRRNAALDRHGPEVVLFLLFGTFILTWGIVGYAGGIAGHRIYSAAYIMLVMIVLLIFIIIDLDRPRRSVIQINQTSLIQLQESIESDLEGNTQGSFPRDIY